MQRELWLNANLFVKVENKEPQQDAFNYAILVEMLLYLSRHTRPDLAFSVSQVVGFRFILKHSHEIAIKQIGRYLLGTKDKKYSSSSLQTLASMLIPMLILLDSMNMKTTMTLCVFAVALATSSMSLIAQSTGHPSNKLR